MRYFCCVLLFLSLSAGATLAGFTNRYDSMSVGGDGNTYSNVSLKRIETKRDRFGQHHEIMIFFHSKGIGKVRVRSLPDNVLKDIGRPTSAELDAKKKKEEAERKHIQAEQEAWARINRKRAATKAKTDEAIRKAVAEKSAEIRNDPERKARIEEGLSAWNGSHLQLTRLIKDSMNDPKSYDHVETVYWDKIDHILVRQRFRGKNAFGALVVNYVLAKCHINGSVIEVVEQGAW